MNWLHNKLCLKGFPKGPPQLWCPRLHHEILKPNQSPSDMPRPNHNSTNESHHPQLQNGHSRSIYHYDWNNYYNRIVNWQQAGTRRHDPSTMQPRLWGLIQGDNLWWPHRGNCKRNPRTTNDPICCTTAVFRPLRTEASADQWDRREIK